MASLIITHIDKKTEEILEYIAKKAGGKIRKDKKKPASNNYEKDFVDEMERIIKDIEKDFYAKKKNSHHKELRKRA